MRSSPERHRSIPPSKRRSAPIQRWTGRSSEWDVVGVRGRRLGNLEFAKGVYGDLELLIRASDRLQKERVVALEALEVAGRAAHEEGDHRKIDDGLPEKKRMRGILETETEALGEREAAHPLRPERRRQTDRDHEAIRVHPVGDAYLADHVLVEQVGREGRIVVFSPSMPALWDTATRHGESATAGSALAGRRSGKRELLMSEGPRSG